MENLEEIRFNDLVIILDKKRVKSSILPKVAGELDRDIIIQGDTIIEGAVYATYIQIENGLIDVRGAVFTQMELHANMGAKGVANFHKAVGSADSVVSLSPGYRIHFHADVNAKKVKLRNAFIAGSIFAEEVYLEDCVVIGGVFASESLELCNTITGTFHSPSVRVSKTIQLLLPSAFSVEPISAIPGTEMYNLSLCDLGALFRGKAPDPQSGKIRMSLEADEIKSVLRSEEEHQVIRSYSVVGKVLAADLLDLDKFNNHFLLTAAALGSQLLKTYDLGIDETGFAKPLTVENIANFFFDILHGKLDVAEISGSFSLREIINRFN
jgi:hypothetical protein